MAEKDVSGILTLKNGSGSRSRIKGLEDEIIAEAERGNYHARRQIADMIEDKFQVRVSVTAVTRLLKKRRQATESRVFSGDTLSPSATSAYHLWSRHTLLLSAFLGHAVNNWICELFAIPCL